MMEPCLPPFLAQCFQYPLSTWAHLLSVTRLTVQTDQVRTVGARYTFAEEMEGTTLESKSRSKVMAVTLAPMVVT